MDTAPAEEKPELDETGEVVGQAAKKTAIHIDHDGNLKLVVGPDAVQMRVDAGALRRASRVFRRMLFGPFRESQQVAGWTVELPEDDPEVLEVIFHAAHANFASVPLDLKLSQLYDITVMADKYAMMGSLQPWAAAWTSTRKHKELQNSDDRDETSYEDLQRLCVLYYLGKIQKFQEVLVSLVLKSRANAGGRLLFKLKAGVDGQGSAAGGQETREWGQCAPLPQSVIDFACKNRHMLISRLLSGLDTVFASCTSKDSDRGLDNPCQALALGLMIQRLSQENFWPIPSTKDVCLSVAELSKIVDKVKVQIESQVVQQCCKCKPKIKGSSRCALVLPQAFGNDWRKQLVENTWMRFWDRSRLWGVPAE